MKLKKILVLIISSLLLFTPATIPLISATDSQSSNPEIIIKPENPTTNDHINITVIFSFRTQPPYVADFGKITQTDNVFNVNISVYLPAPNEFCLQVLHSDSHTYKLGYLLEGTYTFSIYCFDSRSKSFWLEKTVTFDVAYEENGNDGGDHEKFSSGNADDNACCENQTLEHLPELTSIIILIISLLIVSASFLIIKNKLRRSKV